MLNPIKIKIVKRNSSNKSLVIVNKLNLLFILIIVLSSCTSIEDSKVYEGFSEVVEVSSTSLSKRIGYFKTHGIDVSKHQGKINWDLVKTDSFLFSYMKATEGRTYVDPTFRYNWRESKKSGLIRGAYHFYRPNKCSKQQAENFIRAVVLESGDLPPVLDLEVSDSRSKKIVLEGVENWIRIIEGHYGVKPIIYCNRNWCNKYVKEHFSDYIVWVAAYNTTYKELDEELQSNWFLWQYKDTGSVKGIEGNVDMNVFFGDKEEFSHLLIK